MKHNELQNSSSYIGRILIDGATPFLYRSAVRSLLGVSENRNMIVKHNSPSNGFRYAYPHLDTGFNSEGIYRDHLNPVTPQIQLEPFEQQIESSGKAPKEQGNMYISQSQTSGRKHPDNRKVDTNPKHDWAGETDKRDVLSNQSYELNAEQSVSKGDVQNQLQINVKKIKTETPETREKNAEVPFDKSQITIPGFTTSKRYFSAEISSNNDDEQLKEKTLSIRKAVAVTNSPGVPDQMKSVPKGAIRKKMGDENETGDYATVSRISKDKTFPDRQIFSLEKNKRQLDDFAVPDDSVLIASERNANSHNRSATSSTTRNKVQMVNWTNKNNTKEIEQLKNTVNNLAAKNFELESQIHKNSEQTQKQQLKVPPSIQEPVTIKQPAKPSQTSNAFWERRYLSRFHFKMLR